MKQFFLVLLMVLGLAGYGTAQTNPEHFSFIVFVKDTAAIQATPSLNHMDMSSDNPGVQAVFNNYTVYKYEQSTPDSRYPVMRQYYLIEANSLNLMSDLLAYPALIGSGREVPKVLPTYTPSDYYSPWADGSKDLEFVHAPEAWNVTHGNPDILIGINDTRFETSHPDLIGKIVDSFSNYSGADDHGTGVAGYAAGRTDNGDTGLAAIGFNCRMVISTNCTTPGLLTMSNANLRVLNASWAHMHPQDGDCDSPYTSAHFQQQVEMNEVYENGTIPFFGAGNSPGWNNSCGVSGVNDTFDNRGYTFPAFCGISLRKSA